jgi:hypothetical protein
MDDEAASAVLWCIEQAENIMSTTAGAATCDGDPTGVLQYVNSMASDIAINLQMLANSISNEAEHPAPATAPASPPTAGADKDQGSNA